MSVICNGCEEATGAGRPQDRSDWPIDSQSEQYRCEAVLREACECLKIPGRFTSVSAWTDLVAQGDSGGVASSKWLIEHLLRAENTDRAIRSVSHQMYAGRTGETEKIVR